MNKITQYLAGGLAAAASVVGVSNAGAATVTQLTPRDTGSAVALDMKLLNDDTGAVYNSAELAMPQVTDSTNTTMGLDDWLYSLPHNQAAYTSATDLTSDWGFNIFGSGDISDGWFMSGSSFDPISIENIGQFNANYDEWTESNEMDVASHIIPYSQWDGNQDGNYNLASPAVGDVSINLGSLVVDDMFVGESASGFTTWQADGTNYNVNVVPTPTSGALALPALGYVMLRRRRQ